MPVDALRQSAGDQRTDEGAEIDPHVEDGKACIPPRILRAIERAEHGRRVRLQKAGAEHDEGQTGVEKRQGLERQREVAEGDDDAADENTAIRAEQPVGHEPAANRGGPDAPRVRPIHGARMGDVEAQSAGGRGRSHVEDEEGAHPVIAEALPHFCEEQRGQSTRMSEERVVVGAYVGSGNSHAGRKNTMFVL